MSRDALTRLILPTILLLALLLRLWGIRWGLPNIDHYWSYHPDESTVVSLARNINPLAGQFDTQYYNYGAWHPICLSVIIAFASVFGFCAPSAQMGIPSGSEFLVARLYTVLLGVLTCGLLAGIGRRFYSPLAGWLAALLYAITPLAVQHGHWATVDVPATFWVVVSLFFVSKTVTGEGKKPSVFLLLAGLFAGYAAATKYNAGVVLLAAVAAGIMQRGPLAPNNGGRLMVVGAVLLAGVGFVLGCPGVLTNTPKFLEGFLFEANHAKEGSGDIFIQTLPAFLHHLVISLPWAAGWPLAILAIVGTGAAFRRKKREDWILLSFFVPYFILIGIAQIKFTRYLFPIFPIFFLFAGSFIASLKQTKIQWGVGVLVSVWALTMSLGFDQAMAGTDPRDKAKLAITPSSPISFPTGPWYYHPPLHPLLSDYRPPIARNAEPTTLLPAIENGKPVEWSLSLLKEQNANRVIMSEFEYSDATRLSKPNAIEYLAYVKANYKTQNVYATPITFLGIPISSTTERNGLPAQSLPHDMLYTNPTVVSYTR
jgi:hypothetical protein